jgi:uncharacterized protein
MVMFWTIFKKRVFFLYMFICIAGTIVIAYAFQFLVFVPSVDTGNQLFKDVGSISGGSSAVILKQNQHVRIVLDPNSKGTIATYDNDLEAQGGVVFDSSFERLLNSAADKYDNRQYINNIAYWLEDNNRSPIKGKVLIYNTFSGSGLDNTTFSKSARAALEKKGFTITVTNRRETPMVSERLLGEYGQLWILFGESGPGRPLSNTEQAAISKFNGDGKGMLIVAGKHQSGANHLAEANRLSSRYGVLFSGFVEHEDEILISTASHFLRTTSETLRWVLRLVHKA